MATKAIIEGGDAIAVCGIPSTDLYVEGEVLDN
eukprot:COSAG06_NODE_8387_length_2189_cov_1.289952_1_plen_32_part_10